MRWAHHAWSSIRSLRSDLRHISQNSSLPEIPPHFFVYGLLYDNYGCVCYAFFPGYYTTSTNSYEWKLCCWEVCKQCDVFEWWEESRRVALANLLLTIQRHIVELSRIKGVWAHQWWNNVIADYIRSNQDEFGVQNLKVVEVQMGRTEWHQNIHFWNGSVMELMIASFCSTNYDIDTLHRQRMRYASLIKVRGKTVLLGYELFHRRAQWASRTDIQA